MTSVAAPVLQDVIALIDTAPLDPESWQQLAECLPLPGDPLGAKSVEVILTGLRALARSVEEAETKNRPPPAQTPLAEPLFRRMAKSYNDPRLLKEAGMLYLSVWRLPAIALQHFERCQRLGEPERDLRPLIEAAAVAVQRMAAAKTGQKPTYSGIHGAHHANPVVVDLLRQTGMIGLSRVKPAASALPVKAVETPAVAPLPKSGVECLREAPGMIAEGNLARAQQLLLRAGENPRYAREIGQAWASLGKAAYDAGAYPEMELAYQEASKFEPETMACHFNLALAKHMNRKFEQAEALYLTADSLRPDHPKVWCNLGALYFQLRRYDAAEDALRRAIRGDGDYARAWDNLAAALGAQNKLEEALEACRQAIGLRPDYAEAHFKMGVIYFGKGLAAEAAEAFRHASVLLQLAPASFALLGTIHARLEQVDAAEQAIRQAVQIDPHCDLLWTAWNELGKAHYTLGAYGPAAAAFAEATALKPELAEGWFNRGLAHHLAGEREQAREFYRKTVELRTEAHLGWHNLGIVCGELNLPVEAIDAFQHDLTLRPENARGWYDLGVALETVERHAEAQAAFARAEDLEHPQTAHAA
jgi:tetratricopeptide (TPR) repeat protein